MVIKKLFLVASLMVLLQTIGQAQNEWGWDWKDSSKVASKDLPQYNEFLNNQYPYPAKPRNQWELGIGAGLASVIGDVKSKGGFGGSISLRKSLSHVFSIRTGLTGILASGEPSDYGVSVGQKGYKNQTYQFGVDFIASLNTISHYKGNPKTNVYLLMGYALNGAKVLYKNPGGAQPGGYSIFYGIGQQNSAANTLGTMVGASVNGRKSYTLTHGLNLGAGIAFKLSDRMNFALEQKFTLPAGYDYLDGWKGPNAGDYYSLTSARLNFNLGNAAKRVQPLNWINPNNFVYSELNNPKHMKLPKVSLNDADGDGVIDQFDLEPNTPKGAPVDSHGVSRDTDGDGVPDFKDKEVLTPKNCFPVNNDGIGSCPEPACCKELKDLLAKGNQTPSCTIGNLPSVQFKGNAKLTKEAMTTLASAAASINANPNCKVKVIGYGASSKAAQQLSWDRVNAVIKYLTEKQGVSENRVLFVYAQDGDVNTVDLQGTTEEGPNSVPAPHPNLKK